jgi:exonuclease III
MMESHNRRSWNILNWNIMGVNSDDKCNAVRAKIEETACAIFCLQETKRQHFDHSSVRKLAPKRFSKYAFVPSEGTSGSILVGWNNSVFDGKVLYSSKFAITIQFTATHNAEQRKLTTTYGPCYGQERQHFIDWLNSLHIE